MKKHLSFALLTALLAVAIVPASSFAATGASSTPTITVTADTTLTLTIAGDVATPDLAPALVQANAVATYTPASADLITVRDFTGGDPAKDGHFISFQFTTKTFTYSALDSNYQDLFITGSATPGADAIYFQMSSLSGNATLEAFSEAGNTACSDGGTTKMFQTARNGVRGRTAGEVDILRSTETCLGRFVYGAPAIRITGPSDGFGAGTYTSSGVLTLFDDVSGYAS